MSPHCFKGHRSALGLPVELRVFSSHLCVAATAAARKTLSILADDDSDEENGNLVPCRTYNVLFVDKIVDSKNTPNYKNTTFDTTIV